MPVILLSIAMLIISIIFKLAAVFRLTIPLLYVIAMNTFWRSWYQVHQSLSDIIFFVLLGLVVLSWIISLVRKIQSIFQKRQEEKDTAFFRPPGNFIGQNQAKKHHQPAKQLEPGIVAIDLE